MKRFAHRLALLIPVCGLISTVIIGCSEKKTAGDVTVSINDPGEKTFPVNDFFEIEKTVYVSAEGEYLLSDINDAYITDDFAFTLDANQRVSKIDLNTGEIVNQLYQRGRGPQDYLFPFGITGDDEHLYLLDIMSRCIHVYDFDLKHQGKFSLESLPSPSSMFKTKDGFMFFNSFENDSIGKFIITDNEGNIKQSFLQLQQERPEDDGVFMAVVLYSQEFFVPDLNDNVLCYNQDDKVVYRYDGNNLSKLFQFKTEEPLPNTPAPYIKQMFCLNGNILVNHFYNNVGDYAYLDKDFNVIANGIGASPDRESIFSPICQVGNKLISAFTTDDDTPGAILPGKSIQAMIIIHRAK